MKSKVRVFDPSPQQIKEFWAQIRQNTKEVDSWPSWRRMETIFRVLKPTPNNDHRESEE